MKHLNFKIEKTETESKTYIEFNSLIKFLTDKSDFNMKSFLDWKEILENTDNDEEKEECLKFADAHLERSLEDDELKYRINKQFIEFTKKVNENGFN